MKIKVEDMSCKHCVARIEKALQTQKISAKVDLNTKTVEVKDAEKQVAIDAIIASGYTPEV